MPVFNLLDDLRRPPLEYCLPPILTIPVYGVAGYPPRIEGLSLFALGLPRDPKAPLAERPYPKPGIEVGLTLL